jgi:hypothetical protein
MEKHLAMMPDDACPRESKEKMQYGSQAPRTILSHSHLSAINFKNYAAMMCYHA